MLNILARASEVIMLLGEMIVRRVDASADNLTAYGEQQVAVALNEKLRSPSRALRPKVGARRTPEAFLHSEGSEVGLLAGILSADTCNTQYRAIAEALLSDYGTVARVLSAPLEDLSCVIGVTENHARQIKRSYHTLVETIFCKIKQSRFLDYEALIALVLWTIGQSPVEKVQLFYIDKQDRVIGSEVICSGSESFVSVDVPTVIKAVFRKNAAAFIIAHNHPGGYLKPSNEDLDLIESLFRVSSAIGLRLVESMIVSGSEWYSFRENGLL